MSFVGLATAIGGAAAGLGVGATAASIIGGVGAGALGGAGLGALSSAVTGGDIGKGAMFGALGGAVTGGLGSAFGGAGGSAAGASTGTTAAAPTTAAGSQVANQAVNQAVTQTGTNAALNTGITQGGGLLGSGTGISNPALYQGVLDPSKVLGSQSLLAQGGGNALTGASGTMAKAPIDFMGQLGGMPGSVPASPGSGIVGNTISATPTVAAPDGGAITAFTPADANRVAMENALKSSYFGRYAVPIVGAGGMLGTYMATDSSPTQAGPPPGSGDNFLSYYKFNPRRYRPSQPFYIRPANYAAGGIASLNPNPDMMASGPAQVDFMGADAYPTSQQKLSFYSTPSQMPTSAQQAAASYEPATNPLTGVPMANFARGGISDLGGYSDGGRMTEGPGDGMSDSIPASIAGKRPARLAQGEFVVPADVVSHLGNGSTDAGAKQLYSMMDRVRKARTGRKAQGKQIKADKMMPA